MSEFKFSCPNCAQHLAAEEGWSGAQIQCPNCRTQIIVPRMAVAAVAGPPPPPLAPPVTPTPRAPARLPAVPQAPAQTVSGLAIVSLVLALATVPLNLMAVVVGFPIGLFGCVPAVICGHVALGRISNSRTLRGAGLAKWGLGLGYFFILVGVVALGIFIYAKATGQDLQAKGKRRGGSFSYQRPPAASRQGTKPSAPEADTSQPVTVTPPIQPADPPVTTDPSTVPIPTQVAAGTLYGKPFTAEKATYWGGALQIGQGRGFIPDAEIKIFLFLKPGESLADRTFVVSPQTGHSNPHVHLTQRQGGLSTTVLSSKYALRLEFGKLMGKKVPFKLYFEAPQSYQTTVSGNYVADIK